MKLIQNYLLKNDMLTILKFGNNPKHLKDWMKNSCVWYSQIITNKELGLEKFRDYVTKFDYGNRDISGDKGKNNGY